MNGPLTKEEFDKACKKAIEMPIENYPHVHLVNPNRLIDKRRRWVTCIQCLERLDKYPERNNK